jgi:hypothetical protein
MRRCPRSTLKILTRWANPNRWSGANPWRSCNRGPTRKPVPKSRKRVTYKTSNLLASLIVLSKNLGENEYYFIVSLLLDWFALDYLFGDRLRAILLRYSILWYGFWGYLAVALGTLLLLLISWGARLGYIMTNYRSHRLLEKRLDLFASLLEIEAVVLSQIRSGLMNSQQLVWVSLLQLLPELLDFLG